MSRANPQEVRDITGSSKSDPQIQPFLDTAHIMVNNAQSCASVDEQTLTEAEAYLASHLMTVTGGGGGSGNAPVNSESIDGMSISYAAAQVQGQGVLSTNYGQIADLLLGSCLSYVTKAKSTVFFSGGA